MILFILGVIILVIVVCILIAPAYLTLGLLFGKSKEQKEQDCNRDSDGWG